MNFRWSYLFMIIGYSFLYIPMGVLILYSFNDSKLVTVWGGFSLKWYREIWHDTEFMLGFYTSLKIALISATLSVVMGCMAGIALARLKFFSKSLYTFFLPAPLVVPEIITGFSLLILFGIMGKFIGWPSSLGKATIIAAHVTLCMAYVALLVRMRLSEVDVNIEEAAMDLGASSAQIFWKITCPIIMPTIVSGWLLSFTLSFDDLILASFTTGPGTTTLPMIIY